jgi:hypothetical protein
MSGFEMKDKPFRFKSSKAFSTFLQENRDLHKKFELKHLTLFPSSRGNCSLKSSFNNLTSSSYKGMIENTSEGSSSAKRYLNVLQDETYSSSQKQSSRSTPRKICRVKISPSWIFSKAKNLNIEFFQKALQNVMKEPLRRPVIRQRKVMKSRN